MEERSAASGLLAIVVDPQSYVNILYLLFAFPLGIVYFVFLVTGFSLGLGLIITWLGIPILIGVLAASYPLAAFERTLATRMLGVRIPGAPAASAETPSGFWARLRALVVASTTWKNVGYLFCKFPLGIVSFVLVVTLVSLSLALTFAPPYYGFPGANVGIVGVWEVDTLPEALLVAVVGLLLAIGSLHACKWLAWASGQVARILLGPG